MSKEYPSLPETKLGEFIIKGGLMASLGLVIFGAVAPFLLPWILKASEELMEKWDKDGNPLYSEDEYYAKLREHKRGVIKGVIAVWIFTWLFIWFAYATY